MSDIDWQELTTTIEDWGRELGFADVGVSNVDLSLHEEHLQEWLKQNFHGTMEYMARHGIMRSHPELLHPGTLSVISLRIDYLEPQPEPELILGEPSKAYVSRYALGRDYHKVLRSRLKKLSDMIDDYLRNRGYDDYNARVFTDSAPLLEKAVAEKAGLGWIGKNTLLLNEAVGSWYFLGEILTNLPLPENTSPRQNRCGSCTACIDICPTNAIVGPYRLDARKCISYLTIEHRGEIPVPLRKPIGNRVFGCDDCQLVCPWNRYATPNSEEDFKARHGLAESDLVDLFRWTEEEFLKNTEGSPIRRTGYEGWIRNLAVALGNAPFEPVIVSALKDKKETVSSMVDEHIDWAIAQQLSGAETS